jgi:PAS domain S-box-containing protein
LRDDTIEVSALAQLDRDVQRWQRLLALPASDSLPEFRERQPIPFSAVGTRDDNATIIEGDVGHGASGACYDPSSVPSSRDAVDARSAVFDAALDAIVTIDHHGRIVEFNTAAEQIFGRSRESVRGLEIAETIIPERFRAAHHRGLRRYLETGEAQVLGRRIEVAALHASGDEFPVELAIVRVPNSDPPIFTGFIRDLTEQRRLEQRRAAVYDVAAALAEAESLEDAAEPLLRILATTFGASVAAFWVVDGDFLRCVHTYRIASPGDDDFGQISRSLRFAPGDGLPGRVWQSPGVHWVEDLLEDRNLPRAPAVERHGLRTGFAFPIRVGDEVLAVLEFFRPHVSERDADLVNLAESLGHQIAQFIARKRAESDRAQMFIDEQRARLAAEEADRAKDEFLAIVSHELRTPLNAVLGWATVLKTGALSEEKRRRAVEAIENGARTQAQIIEDLLDATRVIRGNLRISRSLVDACSVVQAAIDMIQPAGQQRNIRIVGDLVAGPCQVWADRGRLQQVVANLLSNAVKFTTEGGTVNVALTRTDGWMEIVVRDDGIGIAPELLPHVFERFRQGRIAANAPTGGLGLGLAIVRRLVELHGGRVRAASAGEGKGSTFKVTLPLDPNRPPTALSP